MLELAILGLLQGQELHGYELRRRLGEELGPVSRVSFSNVSFGSLYPALSRLEKAGAVEAVDEGGPSGIISPMSGSLAGELAALRARRSTVGRSRRSRKAYRITEAGRLRFAELLDSDPRPDDSRGFGLRLTFARYLRPEARMRLLVRRREQLVEQLSDYHGAAPTARGRRQSYVDDYSQSLVDHSRDSVERDILWLDRLIETERLRDGEPRMPIR